MPIHPRLPRALLNSAEKDVSHASIAGSYGILLRSSSRNRRTCARKCGNAAIWIAGRNDIETPFEDGLR
jgi:hypothetical protein